MYILIDAPRSILAILQSSPKYWRSLEKFGEVWRKLEKLKFGEKWSGPAEIPSTSESESYALMEEQARKKTGRPE
jgi:hypothetical protein